MAKFDEAFEKVVFHEGGYVNDPDDRGGETYMGISRKAHPNALIWQHVDKITKQFSSESKITTELKKNNELTSLVKKIYKSDYWNPFELTKEKSQRLANQIFDNAVNMGVERTRKMIIRVKNEMASVKK